MSKIKYEQMAPLLEEEEELIHACKQQQQASTSQHERIFQFTSESVSEGHPDKLCDQLSDRILDGHLKRDREAKVAVEVVVKCNTVWVLGEVTSRVPMAQRDIEHLVRETLADIGYDDEEFKGLNHKTCKVEIMLVQQSPEISYGVVARPDRDELGAGDQGLMFGYATDETRHCMPLTLTLAHRLMKRLKKIRTGSKSIASLLGPDGKSQVTCDYACDRNGSIKPLLVRTVVVSVQHSPKLAPAMVRQLVTELLIKPIIPAKFIGSSVTKFVINPAGWFTHGGPGVDTGLTGRKIIVDTYGGWGSHGGGAFSGKDPSKVDRSGAYAARWIAKSLVYSGLCQRCLVQISYAIGMAQPVSISVFSYGTATLDSDQELEKVVMHNFDLRPGAIIKELNLLQPVYGATACFGHFGRDEFTWEVPKQLEFEFKFAKE